jgi:hypothetical protein
MRTGILIILTFVAAGLQQRDTLASLIPSAQVIVVAEISSTDYSRTPSDGPMIAQALVLSAIKGGLKKGRSFTFTETAWVGPDYQKGEVRILFIEPAEPGSWRILSNLYAKTSFFIERVAIPLLDLSSLRAVLDGLPAPTPKSVRITRDMLK